MSDYFLNKEYNTQDYYRNDPALFIFSQLFFNFFSEKLKNFAKKTGIII